MIKSKANNNSELYLAIDQGGHASRAIIYDGCGTIIGQSERPITTLTPQQDWVEHDPDEILSSITGALDDVISDIGDQRHQLVAAGLATQRSSIICWDKISGKALSPVISWQDRRQKQWLTQLDQHSSDIHDRTGLFLSPHYGASKIRWCLDNLHAVKEAQQQKRLAAAPLASYLIYHLTREHSFLVDPANASRTLLWNIHKQNWDHESIALFGLAESDLPQCCNSQDSFGTLSHNDLDLPLSVVTGDQSAALFALGKPDVDALYINIGTGAFIQRAMAKATKTDRLLSGIAFADEQHQVFTLEGTVNGAARALQQHAEKYFIKDFEQQLPHWLATINTPPLFLNGVSGLGSPYWQADFKSCFVGDTADNNHQAQAVAIVESIAFLIQRNIEEIQQLPGPAKRINISGGLANLDGLIQHIANLSGAAITRPQHIEATATGLAFLLASQPARWSSTSNCDHFIANKDELLENRYSQWSAIMLEKTNK